MSQGFVSALTPSNYSYLGKGAIMNDKIVFLHLPKSGGTTLHNLFCELFEEQDVCDQRHNQLDAINPEKLQQFKFFSGHYSFDSIQENIPDPKKIVTLLREPKSRILSAYYFGRVHKWSFIESHAYCNVPDCYKLHGMNYRAAKELSLSDYLEREETHLKDFMINSIAGCQGDRIDKLNRAKQRLRQMKAFGLTEQMEDSVRLIFSTLKFPIPQKIPHHLSFDSLDKYEHIESIEKEKITLEIYSKLEEITYLDRQLYNYAKKIFLIRSLITRISHKLILQKPC